MDLLEPEANSMYCPCDTVMPVYLCWFLFTGSLFSSTVRLQGQRQGISRVKHLFKILSLPQARAWGNEMELYAFWRGESRAYAFTARALDKNLDYAFVS
jgi:hypothetical protein